ncbi:hypothetical protein ScPMuIL_016725 [Solemya velum]
MTLCDLLIRISPVVPHSTGNCGRGDNKLHNLLLFTPSDERGDHEIEDFNPVRFSFSRRNTISWPRLVDLVSVTSVPHSTVNCGRGDNKLHNLILITPSDGRGDHEIDDFNLVRFTFEGFPTKPVDVSVV